MEDMATLVELYRAQLGEQANAINLHKDYSHQYFTLVAAIVGVCAAAVHQFGAEPWLVLVVGIGPMLNILLCVTAIRMCDRFYRRFLEHITVLAKLEALIGLAAPLQETDRALPFPDDKFIIPERWIQSRARTESSAEFIQINMKEGSNRVVRWTFLFLAVANAAFLIGIVIAVSFQVI
jgi:hypothetical protein